MRDACGRMLLCDFSSNDVPSIQSHTNTVVCTVFNKIFVDLFLYLCVRSEGQSHNLSKRR